MGYTSTQQARLDAAQKQVDQTKPAYDSAVANYNSWRSGITCYSGEVPTAEEASSGVTADSSSCYGSSPIHNKGCSQSDQRDCKNLVGQLNSDKIPPLVSAYTAYHIAVTNYNTVLAEVIKESGADPTNIQGNIYQAGLAAIKKYQYYFYIILVLVVGGLIFYWLRYGRKKVAV